MSIPSLLKSPGELTFQGSPTRLPSVVSLRLPPSKSQLIRRIFIRAVQGQPFHNTDFDSTWPKDVQDAWSLVQGFFLQRQRGHQEPDDHLWEAGEAGTVMRFGLAFLVAQGCRGILKGSGRAHERPIGDLVDALVFCGANIEYLAKQGYPPLKIQPSLLTRRNLRLDAGTSSQFISALVLVAPLLGANIDLNENVPWVISCPAQALSSKPYLEMTVKEMKEAGFFLDNSANSVRYFSNRPYQVQGLPLRHEGTENSSFLVEGDWSAASFWIWRQAEVPLCQHLEVKILTNESNQADRIILDLLPLLAPRVSVSFNPDNRSWTIDSLGRDQGLVGKDSDGGHDMATSIVSKSDGIWRIRATDFPDMVPALAMWALLSGNALEIIGIGHLRYKESDRIQALMYNLDLLGIPNGPLALEGIIITPPSSWKDYSQRFVTSQGYGQISGNSFPVFRCFGDHRIAMALSMLALPDLPIPLDEPDVVRKSYPSYWEDWAKFGYTLMSLN